MGETTTLKMKILLKNQQRLSPNLDNVIENNGAIRGVIPYCRTGYVIQYVIDNRKIDYNAPTNEKCNDPIINKYIEEFCDPIITCCSDLCGTYFSTNYSHNGCISFRIEEVDISKQWTIVRHVLDRHEQIHYLSESEMEQFDCYCKEMNYYLPKAKCENFKHLDTVHNKVCDGSICEVVRCEEITLEDDGHYY